MTVLLGFVLLSFGFSMGLIMGAVLAGGRAVELLEEVADLESEIDRLRARG